MDDDVLKKTARKLEIVLRICKRKGPILILMQDNPDPDALASAAALRDLLYARLKKRVTIGYGGMCGRSENRAMMRLLRVDARHVTVSELSQFKTICLVDAQPYSGNNIIVGWAPPNIVIDHHLPSRQRLWTAEFTDIRPGYGATSTIIREYLAAAGVKMTPNLATALFYGIQSDTQELGRESAPEDIEAYRALFLEADKKKLAQIRRASVPISYFTMLAEGLANCTIAGSTAISFIRACRNSDMVAELADMLIRLEGSDCAICYGVCGDRIYLSLRVTHVKSNAAKLIVQIVRNMGMGGGHRRMAGGQVPITGDLEETLTRLHARILKVLAPNETPILLRDMAPEPGARPKRPARKSAPKK